MAGVRAAAPTAKEEVAASPTRVFNMSVLLKNGGLVGAASHSGARLVLPFCGDVRSLCFGGSVVIAAASSRLRRSYDRSRTQNTGPAFTGFARCPMQIKRDWKSHLWHSVAQGFFGGIALALVTVACFRLGLGLATTAFAYLIVIVLLSLMGNFYVSAVLSIIAVAALNYFFAPPIFNFRVDQAQDSLLVIAFLLTSVIVTGLVRKARSQTEAALEAETVQREQASLLNLTHDSIFVRDMNDVITYWNHAAEEFYGWSAEDVVGKRVTTHQLLKTVFPAPLDKIDAELLSTVGGKASSYTPRLMEPRW